jgi:hypothetical protein
VAFPVFIKNTHRRRLSVQREVREVNRIRLRFERGLNKKLNTLFAKTSRQAAEAVRNGGNPLLAIDGLGGEVRAVLIAHYGSVIDTFSQRVIDNQKQSIFQTLIDTFIRIHGAAMIVGITLTTRSLVQRVLLLASQDGLGVDDTARLLIERVSGAFGRSRAATIARTETHAAASFATDEATRQLNLPNQKKRWVSVSDARTRPSHAAANGQEVLIDEPFIIRDKGVEIQMKYPHDGSGGASNNVNCRCLAVYFTEDDDLFE